MDSFELNKIAGAVLSALLVIFGTKTLIETVRGGHGDDHAKAGYSLPMPKDEGASAAAAPKEEPSFDAAKVVGMLANASTDNGKSVFKKCAACHTVDKGGPNRVGPNLWGVVGRAAGASDGFAYSSAMKEHGPWSYEGLAAFLHDPRGSVKGTKMVFAGVKNDEDLASVIVYLRSLSDQPVPLP